MSTRQGMEERLIRDLLRRKRAYEKYFKSATKIDNQAQSAYTSLVKTIVELARKSAATEAAGPEEARRLAAEILRDDYGIEL